VDVTKTKEKKRKEKKKYSESVCVCLYLLYGCLFLFMKIAKIKEEFNILIGSRSRIINLYVSCISYTR